MKYFQKGTRHYHFYSRIYETWTITGYEYKEQLTEDRFKPTLYRRQKGRMLVNSFPGDFFQQTDDFYGKWERIEE